MTAITTRPFTEDDSLLRFAMRADAILCAALGLLVAMVADPLSRMAGLSAAAEWIIGAGLVGYGALLYLLAVAPDIRRVGIGVVTANVAFAAAAVTVLVAGWLPFTKFGAAITVAVTAATLGFAYLQHLGVRRLA